jgi:hypothetical protein
MHTYIILEEGQFLRGGTMAFSTYSYSSLGESVFGED